MMVVAKLWWYNEGANEVKSKDHYNDGEAAVSGDDDGMIDRNGQ